MAKARVKKHKKKAVAAKEKGLEAIDSPLVGLDVRIFDEQQKEQTFGKTGKAVSYFAETKEVDI